MELQTKIAITPSPLQLSHSDRLLLVGSCFTENIGSRLADYGFDVMANPFGILYNPLSMAECLRRCLAGQEITIDELMQHDGLWHSWLHHGSFSHVDRGICLAQCNARLREAHEFMQQGCVLVLTFGTAFAYYLCGKGQPVANCHKVPAAQFNKRMLTVDAIADAFGDILTPHQPAILTVSPIRHWADTPHGNQLSKGTLLLAIEQMQRNARSQEPDAVVPDYFPAYEIMMDELRDYRFYDYDMLHPSALAVDIIWQRFTETYMDADTLERGKKFQQLHKMEAHRPLFPESDAYRRHTERTEALRAQLEDNK